MKTILSYLPFTTAVFFALLFGYAAFSKGMDFQNFQVQLAQSPLLSAWAGFVSYAVIIVEMAVVLLLCFDRTRVLGLHASFGLMVAFTVYIALILNYSDFVPCSCGGVLEKMSWEQHLVFNIASTVLSLAGIVLIRKKRAHGWRRTVAFVTLTAVFSTGSIVALFLSSEYLIKNANNFTRRFPQYPITEEKTVDLNFNSYYFAGSSGDHIYLGNPTSPFRLLKIDFALQEIYMIEVIPGTDHRFQNLRYTLQGNTLYAYDGTVPVIYGGNISLLNEPMPELSRKQLYFDQLIALESLRFMLRVEEKATEKTALATLSLEEEGKVRINSNLLTDKADGGFDADGQLFYDYHLGNAYYMFYYRNQILKLNRKLQVDSKMKTIDTVAVARLNVVTLKDGRKKIAAPPLLLNRNMTAHRGLIFNQSGLRGRHEPLELWNNNAVVDIYTTSPAGYWGSIYVPHRGKHKMSRMLVTDKYFFVLSGNEMVRYRFAQAVTQQFIKGEAENPN